MGSFKTHNQHIETIRVANNKDGVTDENCWIYGWGCFSDDAMNYRILRYPVKFLNNSKCDNPYDSNDNYLQDDLCLDNSDNVISTEVSRMF